MSFASALLITGFFLFFAAIVYFAFRSSRKYQSEKEQQLQTLGFQAPDSAPTRLQSRVEALYLNQEDAELALDNIYHRKELDQELYIFNLYNTKGEGTELGEEIFGMISSQLALPNFSLITIPDFDRDSLIGGLMDKMLDKVMAFAQKRLGLQLVEFPDRPEYQDRFAVFGRDPAAVRDFLRDKWLDSLRSDPLPLQIAGTGDFLTIDFSMSGSYGDENHDMISQYNKFREVCRIFMS
ncbi:MAG: hypothetical protein ACK2TZ_08465 [Anaerolineales bacterium]|jgi:hypothetical protein